VARGGSGNTAVAANARALAPEAIAAAGPEIMQFLYDWYRDGYPPGAG
jgi:hypothetical protein